VWPARTIQIVVPYTPGTGADILARILGPKLGERWKVGVVTDNRAGASGNIGTDFVAKSAPDGYTLLCTATSFGTNPAINQKLPFDPMKSFAPVILLATSTMAVIVTQGLSARSMREFLDLARSQPGKLYYSSPGNGARSISPWSCSSSTRASTSCTFHTRGRAAPWPISSAGTSRP